MHVQSLLTRLDGMTAGDYLTWVRDPEPPALDDGLRSVATSTAPLAEPVDTVLVWAGQPPTTSDAAAVAAGFALTPEVAAAQSATRTADKQRAQSSRARHAGSFPERVSQSEPTTSSYQRRRTRRVLPSRPRHNMVAPGDIQPNRRINPNNARRANPANADPDRMSTKTEQPAVASGGATRSPSAADVGRVQRGSRRLSGASVAGVIEQQAPFDRGARRQCVFPDCDAVRWQSSPVTRTSPDVSITALQEGDHDSCHPR
jgi:hypothetical protein